MGKSLGIANAVWFCFLTILSSAFSLSMLASAPALAAGVTSIEPPNPTTKDNVFLHHTFFNYSPNTVDDLSFVINGNLINVYVKLTVGVFPPPVGTSKVISLGSLQSGTYTISIWATARTGSDGVYGDTYIEDQVSLTVSQALEVAAVIEFLNDSLNHFFISADPDEISSLDNNVATLGWYRTGFQFNSFVRDASPANANPVCRFYGSIAPGPNSHFYTGFTDECKFLKELESLTPSSLPRWNFETIAFLATLPQKEMCPAEAPIPIYRLFNNRARQNDSNHRYVRDESLYKSMTKNGWLGEGIAFCALPD